jgi:hypothetical protein
MTGPIVGVGNPNPNASEGVRGESNTSWAAVAGYNSANGPGVYGVGGPQSGEGVHGESNSTWAAVAGYAKTGGPGVWGIGGPQGGEGVHGESQTGGFAGVTGFGNQHGGEGVHGESRAAGWAGVTGIGPASGGEGVHGEANSTYAAVAGYGKTNGPGVWGIGGPQGGEGVHGESHSGSAAVAGYAVSTGPAGYFKGDVHVTGDVILDGADYAESLTLADQETVPGMTVVLNSQGLIQPCEQEYDSRVVGVVAGGGGVRSALVLDRHDGGAPVAMMGKVWAFAEVFDRPIRCGDLLTTSSTRGHARRVDDPSRAFGCVIGKALTNLDEGRGLVRVLVNVS